jgi:peptidoglycan/xylan/chitin deacetylase (PgdA/CDA1 family)
MRHSARLSLLFTCLLASTAIAGELQKQLVIISFDGAHNNALWQKSRQMAKDTGAHFTYFLSCTFYMTKDMAHAYQAPGERRGRSNVGFAPDNADIATRLDNVWNAHLEGHEIASHACGHFDGSKWSKADWLEEFGTFRQTLLSAWDGIGKTAPDGWSDFVNNDIRGFRAPYLAVSKTLPEAEKEAGYLFDASLVTRGPALPVTDGRLTRFGLPTIPEGPRDRRIIGMDYNLYVRHSDAKEDRRDAPEFEERAYDAFRSAFDRQYDGDRIPLQLGFHFVEMNDGAYWRALDRLLRDVCHKDDVACVTYPEAMAILKKEKAEKSSAS